MFELYTPGLCAHAESRMGAANSGSDADVVRYTGTTKPDPFTGEDVPEYEPVHSGPMRLASASRGAGASRTVSTPGGEVTLATRVAHFPVATPPFKDGDIIRVTDGESAGTRWVVVEADRADQQTAYRVPVVAYTGP